MADYKSDEARRKMREILAGAERGQHARILRYDTPVAHVVSNEWYESALSQMIKRPATAYDLARLRSIPLTQLQANDWIASGNELRRVETVSVGNETVSFYLAGKLNPETQAAGELVSVVRPEAEADD